MKKYMSVILTLALCLGVFAGCGKKEEAAADRLAQIQSKGELVIALEGTGPPGPSTTIPMPWWATM